MVFAMPPDSGPIHLRPAAELSERVLLPGDPHRALAMAQTLMESPRMFNHHLGLWGYTGEARDGRPLTVQSTGIGGPSAAIVVEELLDLGARTLVRTGTCGSLRPELRLGDVLVATAVLVHDGASAALGATGRVAPDGRLTGALLEAAGRLGEARAGAVVSTDLFYDDRAGMARRWVADGAAAVEMEAGAVLRVAERRGAAAGCVLAVTDLLPAGEPGDGRAGRMRIAPEGVAAAGVRLAEVALDALGSPDGTGRRGGA
jgi:uridine phosphorylase